MSSGTAHSMEAQAHVWNAIPQDVLQAILGKLLVKDTCVCRTVSRCWASAVEVALPTELVVSTNPKNLRCKVQKMQQIWRQFPNKPAAKRMHTFQLTEAVSIRDCSNLLRSLMKQVSRTLQSTAHPAVCHFSVRAPETADLLQVRTGPPCQVLIQLPPSVPSASGFAYQRLQHIEHTISQLAANNIKICISLVSSNKGVLPSMNVLKRLAPILQELDCATLDGASNAAMNTWEYLGSSVIEALLSGVNSITSLGFPCPQRGSSWMPSLVKFGNLRRLDIHLPRARDVTHLEGLQGLSELLLTVGGYSQGRCADILNKNAESLLHLALTADSFDDKTYIAMSQLPQLRSFSLEVADLNEGNAAVLAKLRPSQSMTITITRTVPTEVLLELSSNRACITHLTLHVCPAMAFAGVETMQHLTSLTLVRTNLNKAQFQPQPWLQSLTLHAASMKHTDLNVLVHSYPALRFLELNSFTGLQLTSTVILTIFRLQRLQHLCLSMIEGLSAERLQWMEAFLRSQQRIGMAQPRVLITVKWHRHTQNLHVSHTDRLSLSAEFDEERPGLVQRCFLKARGFCVGIKGFVSETQHEAKHPVAMLMAMAFIGIQVLCLKMPAQKCDNDYVYEPRQSASVELHNSGSVSDFEVEVYNLVVREQLKAILQQLRER